MDENAVMGLDFGNRESSGRVYGYERVGGRLQGLR